jgi:hypothetical protein
LDDIVAVGVYEGDKALIMPKVVKEPERLREEGLKALKMIYGACVKKFSDGYHAR